MFDKQDRKAYCRVLAAVALADGSVSTEEFANYESRMGMALLPPEERVILRQELKRGRSFLHAADEVFLIQQLVDGLVEELLRALLVEF